MEIIYGASVVGFTDGGLVSNLFDFTMGDMYIGHDVKSLTQKSASEASFFINATMFRMANSFRFYTIGPQGYHNRDYGLFENKVRGWAHFKIIVLATAGRTTLILQFTNCELVQTWAVPTPRGPIQTIEVKYEGFEN